MPYVEVWLEDPEPSKEQAEAIRDLIVEAKTFATRYATDRDASYLLRVALRVERLFPGGWVDEPSLKLLPIDKKYKKWKATQGEKV